MLKTPEKGAAAVIKRHSLNSTILDYIHQWRVPGILFCSELVVEQLPSCISASIHRQHRRSQDYFCHHCVVNEPEVDVTSTGARLLSKKEMQAEPLDREALQTPIPPFPFDTRSEAWR